MQLFSEKEAAARLRCTPAALRRWRRERRGPKFVTLGRLIRYRESDLESFVEANTQNVIQGSRRLTALSY